jgi:hypothetical protein
MTAAESLKDNNGNPESLANAIRAACGASKIRAFGHCVDVAYAEERMGNTENAQAFATIRDWMAAHDWNGADKAGFVSPIHAKTL